MPLIDRIVRVLGLILAVGGLAFFLRGLRLEQVITDWLLLDPQAWDRQGLTLAVFGGFLVVMAAIVLISLEVRELRDEIRRDHERNAR